MCLWASLKPIIMKTVTLNHGAPEELERKRIAEIKSLSYLERLERLMVIIEVSYMLKTAANKSRYIQDIEELDKLNKNTEDKV